MKTRTVILSALLVLSGGGFGLSQDTPDEFDEFDGPAFRSPEERGRRGHRGPGRRGGFPLRGLDLSEDQRAQIELIRDDLRATTAPLREETRALREALKAELELESPDPNLVGELVISVHGLRQERRNLREAFKESFLSILTEEQLLQLEEMKQRREERRRFRGRPGPEAEVF